jgi:hypothetical protein
MCAAVDIPLAARPDGTWPVVDFVSSLTGYPRAIPNVSGRPVL